MTEQEKRDLKLQNYLRQVVANILFTAGSVDYTQADANNVALQKIANILDQFGMEIEQIIPPMLLQDYFGGVDEASKALSAAGATTAATTTGVATTGAVSVGAAAIAAPALTEAGKISKPFQKVIHLKAVEELINDTMGDLRAAIEGARQSSATNIAQALEEVNADLTKGLITGDPRKAIQKRVMETFARNGVTAFVTSDGKNLPLDFYSMTVTRTKSRNATVQGSANRYKDAGQDLVKITGNGDGCKECSRFRDLVVSLTGATPGYPVIGDNGIRLPPYHPNCRCGHRVFILRFATPAEIEEAKARNAKYHPTKDMRTPAQKASYEREQRLRAQANAAKKQYMNYQSVLGAEAPKSLGAFKAMKRSNSPKYQELKSAYMSEAQIRANRKPKVAAGGVTPGAGGVKPAAQRVEFFGQVDEPRAERMREMVTNAEDRLNLAPSIRERLQYRVVADADENSPGLSGELADIDFGAWDPDSGIIYVNPKALDIPNKDMTFKMIRDYNEEAKKEGDYPIKGTGMTTERVNGKRQLYYDHDSLMVHEIGHALMEPTMQSRYKRALELSDPTGEERWNNTKYWVQENVSNYGSANESEATMEMWSLFNKPDYERGYLPKPMEDLFDDVRKGE